MVCKPGVVCLFEEAHTQRRPPPKSTSATFYEKSLNDSLPYLPHTFREGMTLSQDGAMMRMTEEGFPASGIKRGFQRNCSCLAPRRGTLEA